MKRVSVLAVWVALCMASSASAQSQGFRIPFAEPFRYRVDSSSLLPSGLSLVQVEATTQAAFTTWDNVPCAFVQFSYGGRTGAAPVVPAPKDTNDPYSVSSIFITDPNDPYYAYALAGGLDTSAALALTYAGALYSCDIFLNGFDHAWSTGSPTPAGAVDLQTALTYEIGRCLGLPTSLQSFDDVMHGYSTGQQKRSLTTNDIDRLCAYYPTGGYGAPCPAGDSNCTSGSTRCIRPPLADGGTGAPYCSIGCAIPTSGGGANPCGMPYICKAPVLIPGTGVSGTCLPSSDQEVVVGKACSQQSQCGSVNGVCILPGSPPGPFPSQAPVWDQGYCSQDCTPGQGRPPCPTGSACVQVAANPSTYRCVKNCRPGSTDCRQNYACSQLAGFDGGTGGCIPACARDEDCGTGKFCRACDGVCLSKQNLTASVGDACTKNEDCGGGQTCLKFNWSTTGTCTQACNSTCTACPSGSTCRAVGNAGESYCLRDCQDGTCAGGQQCGYTSNGRGCMPACNSDVNCPTGYRCSFGQCSSSTGSADAGTCALCFTAGGDAGNPAGGGSDGGTLPDPRPTGCGCQTSGSGALLLFAFLLLPLAALRRRSN
ncbi:MAG TPA: hypothetical protein VK447_20030 [Myxococcaceae bacterium]|nr:hypothetical protein [Myxococcaceae bacterium]